MRNRSRGMLLRTNYGTNYVPITGFPGYGIRPFRLRDTGLATKFRGLGDFNRANTIGDRTNILRNVGNQEKLLDFLADYGIHTTN